MTLKTWITFVAIVAMFAVTGLAFAQQPTPQTPPNSSIIDKGLGVSMTAPTTPAGDRITTADQPTVERPTGTSLTVPLGTDGKPLTGTTSFGQR